MTAGGYGLESAETLDPAAMTVLRRIYEEGFPPHQRADFPAVTAQRREDELAFGIGVGGQAEPAVLEAHWVQVRAAGHPRLECGEDLPPRGIRKAAHGDAHQVSGIWTPAWAVRVVTSRVQQAIS